MVQNTDGRASQNVQLISRVDHAKSLGLFVDCGLSWSNYVEEMI